VAVLLASVDHRERNAGDEMIDLRLGDCLEVMKTLPDESVDAIITDPPYGVDYQSNRRPKDKQKPKIENDKRPFIWWLYDAYRVLRENGTLLCFCEWQYEDVWKMAIETAGFTIKSQVIWDRDWHGLGDLNGQFAPQHDIIWFATKGRFEFQNGRPKSVLRIRRIAAEDLVHPNEKPKALMQRLVEGTTGFGYSVLDPFMGSGVTGVVCDQTNRDFIGIEIEPTYYEIAKKRIEAAQQQLTLELV
jgi:DNA modification methylase